jgi:hypothetical protein
MTGRPSTSAPRLAVDVDDIQRSLNELRPTIIHFSGHGVHSDASEASLVVRGIDGKPHHLTGTGLAGLIHTAAAGARLVVLNACYSAAMADPLCGAVDGVVGMAGAIGDPAARAFAVSLYRALALGRQRGRAGRGGARGVRAPRRSTADLRDAPGARAVRSGVAPGGAEAAPVE